MTYEELFIPSSSVFRDARDELADAIGASHSPLSGSAHAKGASSRRTRVGRPCAQLRTVLVWALGFEECSFTAVSSARLAPCHPAPFARATPAPGAPAASLGSSSSAAPASAGPAATSTPSSVGGHLLGFHNHLLVVDQDARLVRCLSDSVLRILLRGKLDEGVSTVLAPVHLAHHAVLREAGGELVLLHRKRHVAHKHCDCGVEDVAAVHPLAPGARV
mmetsp:Transcript_6133/g.16658  ORF Transcript_6133/g.16658 Transcript_6133/m.16658 type:complete len:219 (-) Transcript_6133:313-969(-)